LQPAQLAYFAGFIDGEGCITIIRTGKQYYLHLKVSQCDRRPLDILSEAFGGTVIERKQYRNQSRTWEWRVSSRQAADAIRAMLPYFIVKKEQAILGLEFQDQMRSLGRRLPLTEQEITIREQFKISLSALKRVNR